MGRLFDESRRSLTPAHGTKDGRRYRYYISRRRHGESASHDGWRLRAADIEHLVAATVDLVLKDRKRMIAACEDADVDREHHAAIVEAAARICKPPLSPATLESRLDLVERVDLARDGLRVSLAIEVGDELINITHHCPTRLQRRWIETKLVIGNPASHPPDTDPTLIKAIARAQKWLATLVAGEAKSISAVAKQEGIAESYVRRLLPLAFLAPKIVEIIADGRQPAGLTMQSLTSGFHLSANWDRQREALNI